MIPPALFAVWLQNASVAFCADSRWTDEAIEALQTACEYHLVTLCEDANLCAIHTGRKVVVRKDLSLGRRIARQRS